jgi:hypothetical protein
VPEVDTVPDPRPQRGSLDDDDPFIVLQNIVLFLARSRGGAGGRERERERERERDHGRENACVYVSYQRNI